MRSGIIMSCADVAAKVLFDGLRRNLIVSLNHLSSDSFAWSIADRLKTGTPLESLIAEYGVETVERALRERL